MPKYSLVHLTSAGSTPAELIRVAARAGFDCVGLRGIPTRTSVEVGSVKESITGKSPFALADNREVFLETKKAAEDEGILINDVENARIFEGVDVRKYEKDLEAVANLGVHHVLTNIWTNDEVFYTEKYAELCEIAKKYDIDINLEIVTWSAVPGIKEAASLLNRVEAENSGIVLDTLHFYRSGNRVSDLDGLPLSWFRYIHMCDAPKEIPTGNELVRTGLEERLIPGEGAIDIKGIVRRLSTNVIRGIEVPHKNRIEQQGLENYAKRALELTKKYLET